MFDKDSLNNNLKRRKNVKKGDITEEHVVQVVPSQASSLLSREQLERPQSAINTTRALVRCYNKLLWFGAEIGPVC